MISRIIVNFFFFLFIIASLIVIPIAYNSQNYLIAIVSFVFAIKTIHKYERL